MLSMVTNEGVIHHIAHMACACESAILKAHLPRRPIHCNLLREAGQLNIHILSGFIYTNKGDKRTTSSGLAWETQGIAYIDTLCANPPQPPPKSTGFLQHGEAARGRSQERLKPLGLTYDLGSSPSTHRSLKRSQVQLSTHSQGLRYLTHAVWCFTPRTRVSHPVQNQCNSK